MAVSRSRQVVGVDVLVAVDVGVGGRGVEVGHGVGVDVGRAPRVGVREGVLVGPPVVGVRVAVDAEVGHGVLVAGTDVGVQVIVGVGVPKLPS